MRPQLLVRIRDASDLFATCELTARGREAWCLKRLVESGERGVSALEDVGPRLSHYIHKLRRAGLTIETIEERHGGPFAGIHGRYVLRTPVEIVRAEGLPGA